MMTCSLTSPGYSATFSWSRITAMRWLQRMTSSNSEEMKMQPLPLLANASTSF